VSNLNLPTKNFFSKQHNILESTPPPKQTNGYSIPIYNRPLNFFKELFHFF
jgi:hypothetical protein